MKNESTKAISIDRITSLQNRVTHMIVSGVCMHTYSSMSETLHSVAKSLSLHQFRHKGLRSQRTLQLKAEAGDTLTMFYGLTYQGRSISESR